MAISPDDGVGFREHYTQNAECRARRNSQKIIIAMGAAAEAERVVPNFIWLEKEKRGEHPVF
jgi:hypothetical protein